MNHQVDDHLDRITRFKGTPREIGFAAGRRLGVKLGQRIDHYIALQGSSRDMQKVREGALPWMRRLPIRFQEELEGMAEGSGVSLQRIVEWSYIEEAGAKGCSSAIGRINDQVWVARNNDLYVPELWGYAAIREIEGRIPTLSFTMEGDVFTPTGINMERLWLHYNFLPVWDSPALGKPHVPAFAFLTEALELCRSISEVETFLENTNRDGGMMLFVVDGKTNEFAVFECLCSKHYRREPLAGWIIGTNHYCATEDLTLTENDKRPGGTLSRFNRMEELIYALSASRTSPSLPADLIRILADDGIERREKDVVTVYSNVACPAKGELWNTFGGYPSASQGNWQRLEWPW